MAQFPTYLRQASPQGQLAPPQGPTPGEALGAGLQDLGAGGEDAAIRIARANASAKAQQNAVEHQTAIKGVLDFSNTQDQAYRDAVKAAPPGAAGFSDTVLQNFDKAVAEKRNAIPASQGEYFDEQMLQERGNLEGKAATFQDTSRVDYINTQSAEIIGAGASQLVTSPEKIGFIQRNVLSSIQALDASDVEKKQLAKAANRQLNEAALSGTIQANPVAALADINAGKYDNLDAGHLAAMRSNAVSQIRANEEHARAAQHEADYQKGKAQAVADKAAKQQADMNLSDLSIGIERGTAGYQDVESAYNGGKGWLSPSERAQAVIALDQRGVKDAKAQASLDFVAGAKTGAYQIDPKNADQMKAVDADYLGQAKLWTTPSVDPAGGAEIPAKTPAQIRDLTLGYVTKLGVVPEALQGQIRGQLRNGGNEQMAASADMLEQFRQINPALLDDFSKPDIERATAITDQVNAGVPIPQAVKNTLEQQQVAPTVTDSRTKAYDDLTKPPTGQTRLQATQGEIQGAANSTWQRFVPFKTNPAVPPEMAGDYDLLKRDAYLRTGDMGQAQKSALDSIGRTWGQSAINGTVTWMKTPPENFYSAPAKYALTPEQNTDWMKDQLVQDFTKGGVMVDASAGAVKDRLSVVPSNRVNAQGQPLYQVMFKDSMGNIGPAVSTDKNGQTVPTLWAPDWETSTKKQEIDAQQAQHLGQLQTERQRQSSQAETERQTGIKPLMLGMMSPAQIKGLETRAQTNNMLVAQSAGPAAAQPTTAQAPASDSMLTAQSAGPGAPIAQPDQLQADEATAEPKTKQASNSDNPSFLQRIIKGATDAELGILIKQAKGDVLDTAKAEQAKRDKAPSPSNLPSAPGMKSLGLTPQEQFLYQWHVNNITGQNGGKAVHNSDGSTSTILQMSEPVNGKWYNVPSVWDGKKHTEDQAFDHAAKMGWDKWPSYATEKEAEARYQKMHAFMEKDVR